MWQTFQKAGLGWKGLKWVLAPCIGTLSSLWVADTLPRPTAWDLPFIWLAWILGFVTVGGTILWIGRTVDIVFLGHPYEPVAKPPTSRPEPVAFPRRSEQPEAKQPMGRPVVETRQEIFEQDESERVKQLRLNAIDALNSENHQAALAAYEELFKLTPDRSGPKLNYAKALGRVGRFEESYKLFQEVIDAESDCSYKACALLARAEVFSEHPDHRKQALKDFKQVSDLQPPYTRNAIFRYDFPIKKARLLKLLGRTREAEECEADAYEFRHG